MDANFNESPVVRDPQKQFESFYHDMDSGYQSFDVKDSSITLAAATHSTPVKRSILPDLSAGFTIAKGCLLQETIDEVPSTDTPKKRKCIASTSNSIPKKLRIYNAGHRTKLTSSSKRKLIPDDNRPIYIPSKEGRTYVDLITGLNDGYSKVLREIFRLLSSEDLHNMTLVSHKWSAIINENTQTDLKINLKNFQHKLSDSKENLNQKYKDCCKDEAFKAKKPFSLYNKMKKKELKRANTLAGGELYSSPSKKAAIKNDWLFSTICNEDETTSCPHCCKVSRILQYKTKASKTPSYINSLNEFMSYTNPTSFVTSHFQYDSPESSPSSQSSPRKQDDANIPLIKYGECTNIKCKFKFCLECLCEFHGETPCILTKQVSPSKEDMENGILQAIYSPSSSCSTGETASKRKNTSAALKKRAKKSLKRLCF